MRDLERARAFFTSVPSLEVGEFLPFFPQGRIGRRGLPIGLRAVYGREWNAGDGDWSGINITKLRQGIR